MACRILVPWLGIEPAPPAAEAWHPNHWTAREEPSSQLKIKVQVLYDGLEGPSGSGSCLLCDLICYHCYHLFLLPPWFSCCSQNMPNVLLPQGLCTCCSFFLDLKLIPSPPFSICSSVTSSYKPALTTSLNWTFFLCSLIPLPCYNSLHCIYHHLSSSQSVMHQPWSSPRLIQNIFITQKCYLPFCVCWHLHQWYRGSVK